MLMDQPKLWSIFDSHYINGEIDCGDLEFKAKKDAFIYYILNSFEIVFENFHKHPKTENWDKWTNFFWLTFSDSLRFREIIRQEIASQTYSNEYTSFLNIHMEYHSEINEQ
jgi:hypothetical protein